MIWAIAALMTACLGMAPAPKEAGLGLHAGSDNKIEQYESFGDWLGRKVMYRVVFCDATRWEGIARPYFLDASERWLKSDPGRWEILSVPLLPDGERGNFKAVSDGAHDADFRSLARQLVDHGIATRAILRLGWEFNGDWFAWSATRDPAGYKAAFRRAVRVMRETAPGLKIDWCANRGSSGGMRWTDAYPGDDVVDIISMDVYDHYNSGWDDLVRGDAGLQALQKFARAHGKPEAYPEWGCSTDTHGHGDNPAFVEHMADWFFAAPAGVVYQGYWNTPAGGPNAVLHGEGAGRVPNAASAYRRRFATGTRGS
jgi:hypothetical protein